MTRKRKPTPQQIKNAYAAALKKYGSRQNVTAVDYGYQYKNGKRTKNVVVRIHVNEKIPAAALEAVELLPDAIEGVPIDVVEATYRLHRQETDPSSLATRRLVRDPVQPGISVGHFGITAGTLGGIVYDNVTGRECILSNWHVLAGSPDARTGDPILQPGPIDGGNSSLAVANLDRRILNAHGDAAIAELNGSRNVVTDQFGSGVQITNTQEVQIGDEVTKSGRSTGITCGIVDGIGTYPINYGEAGVVAINGFKIVPKIPDNPDDEELSTGGDSGSLWYLQGTNTGVGLHFAGETSPIPGQENALACHLPRVLDELNVSPIRPPHEAVNRQAVPENLDLRIDRIERKIDRLLKSYRNPRGGTPESVEATRPIDFIIGVLNFHAFPGGAKPDSPLTAWFRRLKKDEDLPIPGPSRLELIAATINGKLRLAMATSEMIAGRYPTPQAIADLV